MKMVKSLLLGSAAGVVAVAGAQAADLPVKAKPVQYVKICTLYGDGFYYIPGSDTCIRFSGYIRADYGYNVTGARTAQYSGAAGAQDRTVSNYSTRHRGSFSVDTRTQTAYGTLRTFSTFHLQNENTTELTNIARAFIQWGGFTFGRTVSFTDHEGSLGDSGMRSLHQTQNQSDTGANGTNQIAYTWQLGNGVTLNIGADERRVKSLTDLSRAGYRVGGHRAGLGSCTAATTRILGCRCVSTRPGAVQASRSSPTTTKRPTSRVRSLAPSARAATPPPRYCGTPGDDWGWAVISGTEIKLDFLSPGSRFGAYFNYGVGAAAYSRRQQPGEPRPLWQRQHDCIRRDERRRLCERPGHPADHGVDGWRRVRILLDAQLLEHDLRQLHRSQLQQHRGRRPLVLRWRRRRLRRRSWSLRRRRAIRASSSGRWAPITTGSRCPDCGSRST